MLFKCTDLRFDFAGVKLQHHICQAAGLDGNDVALASLAQDMSGYLLQSRSDNTNKKYLSYFVRFKLFMSEKGKAYLPSTAMLVSLFLCSLLNKNVSYSVMCSFVYAIKYVHELYNFPDPTSHSYVKNLLEACKRRNSKPVHKKDTVNADNIKEVFIKYLHSDDLIVVRDLAIIILSFCGFLRYDEVSNLKCTDIKFHPDYLSVSLDKCKNDQYRSGNEVLLSRVNSPACPVAALSKYVTLAKIDLSSSNFLFKPCFKYKGRSGLIKKNKRLSYTRARESVLTRLREVTSGLNLGLHSLRSGGATAAANSHQVNERCLKRHGRWKTDKAKDGYVLDSVEDRLAVSKSLGL